MHVNPLCINLNFSVHNPGLMHCRQHGAFARVHVNHVDVHHSQNSLQLMGDVGPLILFYLPMGCWLQAVFFLNVMGWSLERGENTVCSAHPSCLWKSCLFPAVLNQEYWWLTFKLLLCKLAASWRGSEWEGKWRATYLHINERYTPLYYVKAWFCMCLHGFSKGETQSLAALEGNIWL